ncbi:nuclease-related domain-containing protein [Singulisphaera sp. PoT]|uniref:nuclease-related domain-containing protein n=1 Tax=Singulisphaera sp. PoT TaxID=3411797 RepID=UPI003BF4E970
MTGFFNRIRQWSEIRKIQPVAEEPDVTGGRDGEQLLKQLIGKSFPFKGAQLFAGRRIPSKRQGRRREIDLIVCTPQMIHLIEIKNWSGQLDVRNGHWRQTRRSGEVVDHGNLLESNDLKRDAVVEYLEDRGVKFDGTFGRDNIVAKVVFMNPNLQVEPAVEAREDVITRRELEGYLGGSPKKGFAEAMFSSLIESCLNAEARVLQAVQGRKGAAPYEKIVKLIAETGTWDQLHFYGSKVVAGDLAVMKVGPKVYRETDLIALAGGRPIRLHWTRHWFWALAKIITGLGSLGKIVIGKERLPANPGDTVTFHAVGERESQTYRLVEIVQIDVGP